MISSPSSSAVIHHLVSYKYFCKNFYCYLLGGGRHRGYQGPRLGQGVGHELRVSLEDLYNGKTKKLVKQTQSQCRECGGEGETWSAKDKCPDCKGKKVGRGKNVNSVG